MRLPVKQEPRYSKGSLVRVSAFSFLALGGLSILAVPPSVARSSTPGFLPLPAGIVAFLGQSQAAVRPVALPEQSAINPPGLATSAHTGGTCTAMGTTTRCSVMSGSSGGCSAGINGGMDGGTCSTYGGANQTCSTSRSFNCSAAGNGNCSAQTPSGGDPAGHCSALGPNTGHCSVQATHGGRCTAGGPTHCSAFDGASPDACSVLTLGPGVLTCSG